MATKLEFHGLAELRAALRRLPAALSGDAGAIVTAEGLAAASAIEAAYPRGPTGNLKAGVKVQTAASQGGARAKVRSGAAHSHLYEAGTGPRTNDRGANRGRMPERRVVGPAMRAHRRAMEARLAHMLEAHGLAVTVTG